jgi:rhamnulokinase
MTPGSIVRCCLDSLALRYRWVLEALEHVANRRIDTVRVVGGGSQNRLLNQLTADVSGRRVIAGPVEATALGNVVLQAIGTGVLPNVEAGRQVIAASVEQAVFEPAVSDRYDDAFDRFMQLAGRPQ